MDIWSIAQSTSNFKLQIAARNYEEVETKVCGPIKFA